MTAERYPLKLDVQRVGAALMEAIGWREFPHREAYRDACQEIRAYVERPKAEQNGKIVAMSRARVTPPVQWLARALSFYGGMVVAERTTRETYQQWLQGIHGALKEYVRECGREDGDLVMGALLAGIEPLGVSDSYPSAGEAVGGEMIRQRRTMQGLTVTELAARMGLGPKAVRRLEGGEGTRSEVSTALAKLDLPGVSFDVERAGKLCEKLSLLATRIDGPGWYPRVALRCGEDVARAVVALAASSLLVEAE